MELVIACPYDWRNKRWAYEIWKPETLDPPKYEKIYESDYIFLSATQAKLYAEEKIKELKCESR